MKKQEYRVTIDLFDSFASSLKTRKLIGNFSRLDPYIRKVKNILKNRKKKRLTATKNNET